MKRIILFCLAIVLTVALATGLFACNKNTETTLSTLWQSAIYTEDQQLGTGSKTFTLEVTAENKTVKFTVKTDKTTVGEALLENDLIAGEEGAYGLYIKVVNGITADYDIDKSYWSFYIGGEYALTGVDTTEIAEGEVYSLVYTK